MTSGIDRSASASWPRHSCLSARGFTLVELVIVIMVVGILALVATPRFFDRIGFDARAFSDQTRAMLRYAQKLAVAQRRDIYVAVGSSDIRLCYDAACAVTVARPGDAGDFRNGVPQGVTLTSSAALFRFTAIGRPLPDATQRIQVSGGGDTHVVNVERETGYVH